MKTEADTRDTLLALIEKSLRPGFVPVRRTFVQGGTQGLPVPGPLAGLVSAGDDVALDLYLTALMLASAEPHAVVLDARVWARALGLMSSSGPQTVSRGWARLERRKLVRRGRAGKLARVTILREDASGEEYRHPADGRKWEAYFRLPLAYWTDGYVNRLSLPAKAMLLVARSLKDGFVLPLGRARPWYGLSEATASRGFSQLRDEGVVETTRTTKPAPLAPHGFTQVLSYRLIGPFDGAVIDDERRRMGVQVRPPILRILG